MTKKLQLTKRSIEVKGELCAYCDEKAEFISLKDELPLCFQCIHDGNDL